MPLAVFSDPALFEPTPTSALAKSVMNGFNKGIETLYARNANNIRENRVIHGLRLLTDALPGVADGDSAVDSESMDRAVVVSVLVQLHRRGVIVQAFEYGFARRYNGTQGALHAIVVPHVLRYLFARMEANRGLLATGLGIDSTEYSDGELANAIIDAITAIRDAIGGSTSLSDIPETRERDLPAITQFIVDELPMERAPSNRDCRRNRCSVASGSVAIEPLVVFTAASIETPNISRHLVGRF